MKRLAIAAVTLGLATNAEAIDLDPFYLGVFGGAGLAATSNTLVQNGMIVGEFPTTGTTVGTLGGIVAGYNQQIYWAYWGVETRLAYDVTRQCFSLDCAAERHPGVFAQEVGELGVAWHRAIFAARFGAAERTNNLCAFDLPALERVCPGGMVLGWDAGAEIKFRIDAHTDMSFGWDHIGWSGYSASTPVYANFSNTVSIKREEVFSFSITFH